MMVQADNSLTKKRKLDVEEKETDELTFSFENSNAPSIAKCVQ